MTYSIRHDACECIRIRLAQELKRQPQQLTVLSPPHRNSPFLTLAEDHDAMEIARDVIKILVLSPDDSSWPGWKTVLEWERERLANEFDMRVVEPRERDQRGATLLDLPILETSSGYESLVSRISTLGWMRRADLIEGSIDPRRVELPYFRRPFILLPRIKDALSRGQRSQLWRSFRDQEGLTQALGAREDLAEGLKGHFLSEGLIQNMAMDRRRGDEFKRNLFMTSAWRYAMVTGTLTVESVRKRTWQ